MGPISRRSASQLAEQAEQQLHMEVNMERVDAETWKLKNDRFTAAIADRPLVELNLREEAS